MAITRNEIIDYSPPDALLKDRVILVTGAGDGIGLAVANDCAAKGATVVLVGKTVSKLEKAYDTICAADYAEPVIFPMDLRTATWDDYQTMAGALREQLGGLNGLVLNAATVPSLMPFQQITPQQYSELMTVNLHSPFLMIQACLELMRNSADPAIVFSTHRSNRAYWGTFGIAKAGLVGMLDILAHEMDVADNPVRVNGVDSGPVYSNLRRMIYPAETPQQVASPGDVTSPYLFFLGGDSQGITGINLELSEA